MIDLVGALIGCVRGAPVEVAAPAPAPVPTPGPVVTRTPVLGPARWVEPGGLALEVPSGWAGSSGPPPLLLALGHVETGVGLEVIAVPVGDPLPDRPGFELWFEDAGAYRSVPVLGATAATRSWVSTDPAGPSAQSWYGPVGDRTIELVAIYPHDRSTEGEKLVTPLMHAIGEPAVTDSERPATEP